MSSRWKSACVAPHKGLDVRAGSQGARECLAGSAWLTCVRFLRPCGGHFHCLSRPSLDEAARYNRGGRCGGAGGPANKMYGSGAG